MNEPTIYKPSIYNCQTVYNNGGGGGGGGGEPIINPNIKTYLYHEFIPNNGMLQACLNLEFTIDDELQFSFMLNDNMIASEHSTASDITNFFGNDNNGWSISDGYIWDNGILKVYFGNYWNSHGPLVFTGDLIKDTLYNVKINKEETIINGNSYPSLNYSNERLAYPRVNSNSPGVKLYEMKIFKSGALKYRYVPAVYNGTSRGIYECIEGNFYQYEGNRNVVLGPEMPL